MGILTDAINEARYPLQHEAEERIVSAVVTRIKDRASANGDLASIVEVVDGDEDRREPHTPALWVVPGEVRPESARNASHEVLTLDLILQADVRDMDPKRGNKLARKLATIAYKELLRDDKRNRQLDLGLPQFVNDVFFSRSQKAPPVIKGQQSYVVTMKVRFMANR